MSARCELSRARPFLATTVHGTSVPSALLVSLLEHFVTAGVQGRGWRETRVLDRRRVGQQDLHRMGVALRGKCCARQQWIDGQPGDGRREGKLQLRRSSSRKGAAQQTTRAALQHLDVDPVTGEAQGRNDALLLRHEFLGVGDVRLLQARLHDAKARRVLVGEQEHLIASEV